MKTSAGNQFLGRVAAIRQGPLEAKVLLDIGGDDQLAAVITRDSLQCLGLAPGVEAYALVKAPWVILSADEGFRTSARNRPCGTLVRCQEGAVNAELVLELPGGKLVVATIARASLRDLGLSVGTRACAHIKASRVFLAVRD